MSQKKKSTDQRNVGNSLDDLSDNPIKNATEDLIDNFQKLSVTVARAMETISSKNPIPPDFTSQMDEVVKGLATSSQNLQNMAMSNQVSPDGPSDISPFMYGMARSMVSKDVLYPLMKSLVKRYAIWLNKKRGRIPRADIRKYEHIFDLMQKLCLELEVESDSDSQEQKDKRFARKCMLMQEIQSYGDLSSDTMID